eukprot:COSAG02_NODE_38056_length_434_cov_0.644776_1_plen_116_part_01
MRPEIWERLLGAMDAVVAADLPEEGVPARLGEAILRSDVVKRAQPSAYADGLGVGGAGVARGGRPSAAKVDRMVRPALRRALRSLAENQPAEALDFLAARLVEEPSQPQTDNEPPP